MRTPRPMEAFLSLYEATNERKWLDRAGAAGDFAETWMWLLERVTDLEQYDPELLAELSAPPEK